MRNKQKYISNELDIVMQSAVHKISDGSGYNKYMQKFM